MITKQRIAFHTLGCRLNQSETAGITNAFEANGYDVVDMKETADIAVINTCTVTENGDADTRREVNRLVRRNPQVKIALIGCQAQVQKERLLQMPNVCWVVGNERKMDLINVFREYDGSQPAVVAPTIKRKPFKSDIISIDRTHTRANLKIQDGCDFFCSFCEIPYARGRARSRDFNNLVMEAQALVAAGHQEIVLTGINIGTYDFDNKTIVDVVDALHRIEGLARIRISSIEPTTIPMALIDMMATHQKLCPYLHIPIQSGHDKVLNEMNRQYTVAEFAEFIQHAHDRVDGICIGTDVIVGFPGETQIEFEKTYQLLHELPIDYFHVFSYSPRYLAHSRKRNNLPISVIQERSRRLRQLSRQKRASFYQEMLGSKQRVIFEQQKDGFWTGLTDNYVRVKVNSPDNLANRLRYVNLKAMDGSSVHADFIE